MYSKTDTLWQVAWPNPIEFANSYAHSALKFLFVLTSLAAHPRILHFPPRRSGSPAPFPTELRVFAAPGTIMALSIEKGRDTALTPAPTVDINQRLRKLANLHTLNIPDLFQLGRLSPVPNGLKEHTHAGMFEICYYLESSQVYELQGRRCEVQSGDMLIIPPGLPHSMGRPAGGPSMMYYFLFCCPSNTSAFMGLETPLSNYIRDSLYSIGEGRIFQGSGAIRALLEQIIQMYFSDSPFRLLRIRYLTVEFFYHLVRQIERDERSAQMPEDIRDVLEYVESLPTRHFSSEELALRADLPLPVFQRKFKAYTGFTPNIYMVRRKIQLSQELLRGTFMPATEIASKLGFSSSQHFSTMFKRFCGLTPNEYRKQHQEPIK